MPAETDEILFAEIGKFVVEFEGLMQRIKESIQVYFRNEKFYDLIPIEVLMYDSTSSSLANYFKAISLHYLNKNHSKMNENDFESIKKLITETSKKISHASELRNDIVHSTWYLSSIYGTNAELEANRIKVTNRGAIMRKLAVQPGIMDNSISMINSLADFIQSLQEVVSSGSPISSSFQKDEIKSFNEIDFDHEREKLFIEDSDHYKNVMKYNEEMRKLFTDFEQK